MSQEFIQPRQDSLKCIFIEHNEMSSGTRRLQLLFLFILKGRNQAELTDNQRWWTVSSRKHPLVAYSWKTNSGNTHTHTGWFFYNTFFPQRGNVALSLIPSSIAHVLLSWTFFSPCSLWLTLHHRGFGVPLHSNTICFPQRDLWHSFNPAAFFFSFQEIFFLQIHSTESEWKKPPDASSLSATAAIIMWGLRHVHICSLHIWSKDNFSVEVQINTFFLFFLPHSDLLPFLINGCNSLEMGGLSHLSAQLSATTPPVPAGR